MNYNTFINSTIMQLETESFEALRGILLKDYLGLTFLKPEEVSKEFLAEKMSDYFEKIEIKTDKAFEKHLDTFYTSLDSIVGSRIESMPKPKKNDQTPVVVPRARKYYDKAMQIKGQEVNTRRLLDYSRLMMCLYVAIVKNNRHPVSNLDYSADCIDPVEVLNEIKNEDIVFLGKRVSKKKFDASDCYGADACTLVIAAILLYKIVNDKIQEEYSYE